jgi:hypothetical protein
VTAATGDCDAGEEPHPNDIDVISLPGLAAGTPDVDGTQSYYPTLGKWALHCPASASEPNGTWIGVPIQTGDADSACGTADAPVEPDEARLDFQIDPWGRLNGDYADVPFSARYNVRWTQLAVNFVGTGVKNCTLAADPDACYTQEFISYNLSHYGPAWITDYDEVWRFLDVSAGQIEAGKGLAAELFIDPLQDGWSNTYISSVARTEYELRPLGGNYEIDFAVPPEVVLDNIERVQLLVGSTYWVKQQQ